MHQKLIDNQPETAENQLELIPAGRWGHPCEMGALTAFLCSSGAGYVNGVDILADWRPERRDLCSANLVNFFAKCFQNSEIKMDMKWAALRSGKPPILKG